VHAVAEEALAGQDYVVSDAEGHHDPHVWMDVSAWSKVASQIAVALAAGDPENAAFYQERAATYRERLDALDTYARKTLASIPKERRVLVTAHDAFGYMARAYGLEVRGVQGISTESEASTSDIQELVNFIVEREIPAIFIESSVPQRTVEALQAAVQAKGFDVQIGGELFSDAMGDPDTEEGTYPGMVRHNIDTIVSALKGEQGE
jgi:manganese/zinc/iron transport system substrate-binding protein